MVTEIKTHCDVCKKQILVNGGYDVSRSKGLSLWSIDVCEECMPQPIKDKLVKMTFKL